MYYDAYVIVLKSTNEIFSWAHTEEYAQDKIRRSWPIVSDSDVYIQKIRVKYFGSADKLLQNLSHPLNLRGE